MGDERPLASKYPPMKAAAIAKLDTRAITLGDELRVVNLLVEIMLYLIFLTESLKI